jgi:hypothetical protein
MSRSPKYSFAQLGKKVRDQVHHDRDARHLRREAAATRSREQLLAAARTEVLQSKKYRLEVFKVAPPLRPCLSASRSCEEPVTEV